ncbi:unnamed protein product [Moneuplotes crassus]|uniref:Uncharacterized protein n=2 Tax=Euplotes crassus TaxID=5936 RepID=A0AAD1XYF7_EUPCR|nr:unnamed protein product [Moneuplotes crassus]
MKFLLLVAIIAIVVGVTHAQEDLEIPEGVIKQTLNGLYAQNPGFFESFRQNFFGFQRDAWNGMINGFNEWGEYRLKNSCMGSKFQDFYIAGVMKFIFKVLTGQYLNVLQIFYDGSRAYNFIHAELKNCYGKEVLAAYETFWLRTPIHISVAAIVMHLANEGDALIPQVIIFVTNFVLMDYFLAFRVLGDQFKGIYAQFKAIDF